MVMVFSPTPRSANAAQVAAQRKQSGDESPHSKTERKLLVNESANFQFQGVRSLVFARALLVNGLLDFQFEVRWHGRELGFELVNITSIFQKWRYRYRPFRGSASS
jgi:hypothetical protein